MFKCKILSFHEQVCYVSKSFECVTDCSSKQVYFSALDNWFSSSLDKDIFENKKIAYRLILDCVKSGGESLLLENLGLSSVPPLFGLEDLIELSLEGNQLLKFEGHEFLKLVNLKTLDLSDNVLGSLGHLNLSNCSRLSSLNLDRNQLVDCIGLSDLSLLPDLSVLSISSNQLNTLKNLHSLRFAKHLRCVDLSDNELRSLEFLNFENCLELQELYLGNNSLRSVNCTLPAYSQSFTILSILNNKVKSLAEMKNLEKCCYLKHLVLSSNRFSLSSNIPSLNLFPNLVELDLANNLFDSFEDLDFSASSHLSVVYLSSNLAENLSNVRFSGCDSLSVLCLYGNCRMVNCLGFPNFSHFRNLKEINLASCALIDLDGLDLTECVHLRDLDLSYNLLRDIRLDLSGCSNLNFLKLSNNSLEALSGLVLQGCFQLCSLDLSCNELCSLEFLDLSSSLDLEFLNFSSNRLTDVSNLDFFSHRKLKRLRLDFNCLLSIDCGMPLQEGAVLHVFAEGNFFSPRYIADLNSRQNEIGYLGPQYSLSYLSIFETSQDLSTLPSVLQSWNRNSSHPLWQMMASTPKESEDGRLFMDFLLFFERLYNEAPKNSEGFIPVSIEAHVSIFLDALESFYPCLLLLKKSCRMISDFVSTCVDRIGIGLIQLSLQARLSCAVQSNSSSDVKKFSEEQLWVQRVSAFVSAVNEFKIVYDFDAECFIDLKSISFESNEIDGQSFDVDSFSQTDRFAIFSKRLKEGYNLRVFNIGDEVEDVLLILNQLKDAGLSTISGIDMKFKAFGTLKESYLQNAAIKYLKHRFLTSQ